MACTEPAALFFSLSQIAAVFAHGWRSEISGSIADGMEIWYMDGMFWFMVGGLCVYRPQ